MSVGGVDHLAVGPHRAVGDAELELAVDDPREVDGVFDHPDRLDHRPGPPGHRRRHQAAAFRSRQLLRQRQADRCRGRAAALRRRSRVRHERQGRRRPEPAALDERPLDQGDLRAADRPRLPAHGLSHPTASHLSRSRALDPNDPRVSTSRPMVHVECSLPDATSVVGQARSASQRSTGALLAVDRVDDGRRRRLLDPSAEEGDRGLEVAVDRHRRAAGLRARAAPSRAARRGRRQPRRRGCRRASRPPPAPPQS